MTKKRPRTVDDLVNAVGELVDHVKVLVAAVDDLRCEVEWWARNAAGARGDAQMATGNCRRALDGAEVPSPYHTDAECDPDAESAATPARAEVESEFAASGDLRDDELPAQRLDRIIRKLTFTPAVDWHVAWPDDEEPADLPEGGNLRVDEDTWIAMLEYRPVHVVGYGCDCDDEGASPYLLAWEDDESYYLRELTEEEAVELQTACVAAQVAPAIPKQTQRRLWND